MKGFQLRYRVLIGIFALYLQIFGKCVRQKHSCINPLGEPKANLYDWLCVSGLWVEQVITGTP